MPRERVATVKWQLRGQVSRSAFCASLFQAPTIVGPLRIEYPGAVDHGTWRGDPREPMAKEDVDRSR
jgi:hypothetical protein